MLALRLKIPKTSVFGPPYSESTADAATLWAWRQQRVGWARRSSSWAKETTQTKWLSRPHWSAYSLKLVRSWGIAQGARSHDKLLVVLRGFSDAIKGGLSAPDLADDVVDGLGPHERLGGRGSSAMPTHPCIFELTVGGEARADDRAPGLL